MDPNTGAFFRTFLLSGTDLRPLIAGMCPIVSVAPGAMPLRKFACGKGLIFPPRTLISGPETPFTDRIIQDRYDPRREQRNHARRDTGAGSSRSGARNLSRGRNGSD